MASTAIATRPDIVSPVEAPSRTPTPRPAVRTILGRPPAPRRQGHGVLLYVTCFVGYLALGLVLMLHFNYHDDDGLARTANASYVLFSRDPHLSAVGFVWNPLPSLAEIPILLFKGVFPSLLTKTAAGAVMSAAFMAGAVVAMRGIMVDRGASKFWVYGVTVAFALNPMVILNGGDGLSEASYLLLTVWAVRRLIRWLHSDSVMDLVMAGIALGLDFLTRYETVAITAGAALFVLITTWRRAPLSRDSRLGRGMVDAALVATPFAVSFVVWAVVGWIITGSAFSQFSSVYGNSSQNAKPIGAATPTLLGSVSTVMSNMLLVEMLCPLAVIIAVYLCIRRRDSDFLAVAAPLGTGIAFVAVSYLMGSTIENIRYYILLIPLTILAVGMLPASRRYPPPRPAGTGSSPTATGLAFSRRIPHVLGRVLLGVLGLLLVVPAMPVVWVNMMNPTVDPSDYGIRSVVNPSGYPPAQNPQIQTILSGAKVSGYIDSLRLTNGAVLVDTWLGYTVVTTTTNTKQFVITSDLDFVACLNNPWSCGVRYFLVPAPVNNGVLDAINRRYPTMWKTGAGIATLSLSFPSSVEGVPPWRLYQLLPRQEITRVAS
jgi:hypothetical protein